MARVWFARRRGGQWIVPGGTAAYELPLAALVFPLDIGTHRRVEHDPVVPVAELPAEPAAALHKVLIEVEPRDLADREFTGYEPGVYDSPYSPGEVVRRLEGLRIRPRGPLAGPAT